MVTADVALSCSSQIISSGTWYWNMQLSQECQYMHNGMCNYLWIILWSNNHSKGDWNLINYTLPLSEEKVVQSLDRTKDKPQHRLNGFMPNPLKCRKVLFLSSTKGSPLNLENGYLMLLLVMSMTLRSRKGTRFRHHEQKQPAHKCQIYQLTEAWRKSQMNEWVWLTW